MTRKRTKLNASAIAALLSSIALAISSASSEAQEVPGCRAAWNELAAHDALMEARLLVGTDCPVMYREGWLVNPRKLSDDVIPSCVTAWNALADKGSLYAVRFLVTHNCPVIQRNGWRQSDSLSPNTQSERAEFATAVGTTAIPMREEGGTYTVPVLINNAVTLNFVVDSGAADVSIPADVVSTLVRTGTINKLDFIGTQTYVLADGSKVPSVRFRIRSLKVGGKILENVVGSLASTHGSLLLGQSFLSRFKSWSIDNTKHVLLLEGSSGGSQASLAPTARLDPMAGTKKIKPDVSLGYMNLRAGPGQDNIVVARVPAGAGIVITGSCVPPTDSLSIYDFCPVEWNGHEGWISSTGLE